MIGTEGATKQASALWGHHEDLEVSFQRLLSGLVYSISISLKKFEIGLDSISLSGLCNF